MKASLPFKYITAVKGGKHYVVFDYKDNEGKRKRKWVGTDLPENCKKKELSAKVDEIVANFYKEYISGNVVKHENTVKMRISEDGQSLETAKTEYTFTEFFKVWLESIRPTVAETTFEGYEHTSHRIISYFDRVFPDIKLSELKAMELQRFYNDMYASGLSANTIKHYHANIHKALKYAVKMDLITVNESEKTERPKMEKFEAMFYNEHELGLLFNAFRGDRMEIVVLIAAYYGLRRSEIIGLRWDAIDFEKGTITIREKAYVVKDDDGSRVTKFHNQLKTRASHRTLPLIPFIRDLLKEKKEQNEYLGKIMKHDYCHDYDDYICTDNFGKLITPVYVTDHFASMIRKHRLKKLRFHDLRHSCASLLLASGVPMKAIQEWLGHSTFQVTADFYSHLEFNSKLDSADAIAQALGACNASEEGGDKAQTNNCTSLSGDSKH